MGKGAYLVLDTMESGQAGPRDPVPTKAELAEKLSISADTAGRALRKLADMGIVYQVPGHGYFANIRAGNGHLIVTRGCLVPQLE